jgi:hypothetical protein
MQAQVKIQNSLMVAVEQVMGFENSLQKEFELFAEWFDGSGKVNKLLEAKKRQQNSLRLLLDVFHAISENAVELGEYIQKLQGCLLFYGVSPQEVEFFIRPRLHIIIAQVKDMLADNLVEVPEKIRPLIDRGESEKRWLARLDRDLSKEEQKEQTPPAQPQALRYADKPVLGIQVLKQLTGKV